jgi:hypothetical protein
MTTASDLEWLAQALFRAVVFRMLRVPIAGELRLSRRALSSSLNFLCKLANVFA